MIYAISDLHGNYDAYRKALETIHFSQNDTLYVVGDVIDRGNQSIKILQHMMKHANIIPIAGNHEYMALTVLTKFHQEITEEFLDSLQTKDFINYQRWMEDGGNQTLKEFHTLSKSQQKDIIHYLSEFSLYEQVDVNNQKYILVHAGLEPFDMNKRLEDYQIHELLFTSPNLEQLYFEDKLVISGHTPTLAYGYKGKIIQKNNHILIDCGCIYGFNLGIFCLDTKEEFYV